MLTAGRKDMDSWNYENNFFQFYVRKSLILLTKLFYFHEHDTELNDVLSPFTPFLSSDALSPSIKY